MTTSMLTGTLGVLGFIISCVNLWRSIQSTRQAQVLALAQKKHEALSLVMEGEIGNMAARRQLRTVRYEALNADAEDIAQQVSEFIDGHDRALSNLSRLREGLSAIVPGAARHKDLIKMIDVIIPQIKQVTEAKWIAEGVGEYVDEVKENLSLRKRVQQLQQRGEQPNPDGSDV
ncbi:hypothetical protein JWZ98_10960 [Methylomonas sp. EFPC1]|uniref:hypothetical protein n=1 Tax=unclassified Methylomonas TaxID=2608980 RepID=UPI00051BBD79|nr:MULTISPECIES: hypothetical protein [unclassified Methylomonas]QBC27651.1 hypothetical protein U737_12465 [Methylomonas sp. LW13]QSB03397.1 hypothetical protein JWZ98_10960 [Methylomonas sp. EFPC1]